MDGNHSGGEALSEPMTIGVEAYISADYARAERDKLWRKVWQQVGRIEEARYQWQRAMTLDPEPEQIEGLKAKIATGQLPAKPAK